MKLAYKKHVCLGKDIDGATINTSSARAAVSAA